MAKSIISTADAPAAIGTYSQAVRSGSTVYISGQIPLDPGTMEVVKGGFQEQCDRVFRNLEAVAEAAGGSMQSMLKLTIYLVDLGNFAQVNETMARYVPEPFPARAAIEVSALPKGVQIEIEAIMEVDG